jgi:hypothetical protein
MKSTKQSLEVEIGLRLELFRHPDDVADLVGELSRADVHNVRSHDLPAVPFGLLRCPMVLRPKRKGPQALRSPSNKKGCVR